MSKIEVDAVDTTKSGTTYNSWWWIWKNCSSRCNNCNYRSLWWNGSFSVVALLKQVLVEHGTVDWQTGSIKTTVTFTAASMVRVILLNTTSGSSFTMTFTFVRKCWSILFQCKITLNTFHF